MHRKSHLELEKATGMDIPGPTIVRRLLKSLKASTMNVPVATIKVNVNLCTDFDATVNYLRSFISTIDQETRNVSQKYRVGRKEVRRIPVVKRERILSA
jgi:hypothetical protein